MQYTGAHGISGALRDSGNSRGAGVCTRCAFYGCNGRDLCRVLAESAR